MLDYASFDRAVLTDANFQCTPAWPAARPYFFLRIGDFPFSRHASVSRASFSDAVGIDKAPPPPPPAPSAPSAPDTLTNEFFPAPPPTCPPKLLAVAAQFAAPTAPALTASHRPSRRT